MYSADEGQLQIENSAKSHGSTPLSELRFAFLLAVVLRLTYSGLAALFGLYLPANWRLIHSNALTESLPPPNHSAQYLLLGIWQRFDTLWYLHIAHNGYDRADAVVFYPLYPWLIKIAALLVQPITAALLISTAGAFFSFWGFQVLLGPDLTRDKLRTSLLWYALWPSSFIFFAGYPESILLASMLWSLHFARKEKWFGAAALAIAAELTKAVGVIIVVPLFVMAIRRRAANAFWVLLVVPGALAFPAWVRWSGRGAISSAYEYYWRTTPAAPWTTLWVASKEIAHRPDALLVFNLVFLIVICTLVGLSRTRVEYKLFAIAALFVVLCKQTQPPLQSMMRYVLIVFPAFIGVGEVLQEPHQARVRWLLLSSVFAFNLVLLRLFLGWSLIL